MQYSYRTINIPTVGTVNVIKKAFEQNKQTKSNKIKLLYYFTFVGIIIQKARNKNKQC